MKRSNMEYSHESLGTVVTGVIGEDVHIIGIKILEYALTNAGFTVVPLGSQVSQQQFIEAAVETNADALMVSSLSGHAESLLPGLREKCIEASLDNILIYLGGNLLIGDAAWETVFEKFRNMGINRIYQPGTSPAKVIPDLQADISVKRSHNGPKK
jgi:methylaspartate mutase sigma subunit